MTISNNYFRVSVNSPGECHSSPRCAGVALADQLFRNKKIDPWQSPKQAYDELVTAGFAENDILFVMMLRLSTDTAIRDNVEHQQKIAVQTDRYIHQLLTSYGAESNHELNPQPRALNEFTDDILPQLYLSEEAFAALSHIWPMIKHVHGNIHGQDSYTKDNGDPATALGRIIAGHRESIGHCVALTAIEVYLINELLKEMPMQDQRTTLSLDNKIDFRCLVYSSHIQYALQIDSTIFPCESTADDISNFNTARRSEYSSTGAIQFLLVAMLSNAAGLEYVSDPVTAFNIMDRAIELSSGETLIMSQYAELAMKHHAEQSDDETKLLWSRLVFELSSRVLAGLDLCRPPDREFAKQFLDAQVEWLEHAAPIFAYPDEYSADQVLEVALSCSEFAPSLAGYLASRGHQDQVAKILEHYQDAPVITSYIEDQVEHAGESIAA